MSIFQLPKETIYGRVIPKNAFDQFTNSKQKKTLSTLVKRITWTHKLSTETTNLPSTEIKEIQIFSVELKTKGDLTKILEMIDRSIPYQIIFIQSFETQIKISTALKHLHPSKLNQAIVDATLSTDWIEKETNPIDLVLKGSLEQTYISFCHQVAGRKYSVKDYAEFVSRELKIKELESRIKRLKGRVSAAKQFNEKVALNMELNGVVGELAVLLEC